MTWYEYLSFGREVYFEKVERIKEYLLGEICDKMYLTEALHFTYSAKPIELCLRQFRTIQ
jgi:hypothetical protein